MGDNVDAHVATWEKELPWLDPVKEEILARMNRIIRHVTQLRTSALDADGLARWQYKTLLMLRRQGEPYQASPSQLATLLGLTRGALSARLASLEQLGLLTRELDADDRRRVRVRLTAAGNRALESTLGAEEEGETRMLGVLTDAEKQTLAGLLRKLTDSIENQL